MTDAERIRSRISSAQQTLDEGDPSPEKSRWVFEIAWEVANQISGMYTVIKSKAPLMSETLGNEYLLIGPYIESKVWMEIEVMEPEEGSALVEPIQTMRDYGFKVVHGRWLIDGYPKVLLFDVESAMYRQEEWRRDIWRLSNIGVPTSDKMAVDAVVFGFMVAMFFEEFEKIISDGVDLVAHFHEWNSAVGLLLCRLNHINIATIFVLHATVLGRALCTGNVDFYNNIDKFNLNKEAGDRQIYQRYCLERAIAHTAHVFTVVSDILSFEARHLMCREPDLVLPNGLNTKYGNLREIQTQHSIAKEKIHNFIKGHFFGHYDFDLQTTLYFFNTGRYEFYNKGVDMYIEGLARLNHLLKTSNSEVTVVAFLIFPTTTHNFNVESLKGQAIAKQLKDTVDSVQQEIGELLLESCVKGEIPGAEALLSKDNLVMLKRCIYSAQSRSLPPVCTHNVVDDANDPILKMIRKCKLFNHPSDRVKVIFHPEFINSTNPLIGMDYEEFVQGCNLGVFPFYYQPWGYTGAECTTMGIPNISSNLSGFGCFMLQHLEQPLSHGIYIVDRRNQSPEESIKQLTNYMFDFCKQTKKERILQRNCVERLADLIDWHHLATYYESARKLAIFRKCATEEELKCEPQILRHENLESIRSVQSSHDSMERLNTWLEKAMAQLKASDSTSSNTIVKEII